MKIVELTAEHVKRLRAITIKPDDDVVVISGKNGQGKQQPVSESILTPQGWRPIGELKIGGYVIGSDGKSTKIVGIYPQKERKTFMVKMTDGASTRCGPEHLWNVSSWKSVSGNIVWFPEIISTMDLLARGLRHGSARKWSVPIVNPVEFSDSGEELPINSYALGIILGDGHIEPTGYVTITSVDSEIFDILNVKGWRAEKELGTGAWSRPLRHLGLAGMLSHDKFIPEVYQYASIEDRKLLFFGLMDSDGTPEASWASYCSTSERLVDDIVQLGSSLGYLCKKRRGSTKKYRYNGELKEGRMAWNVLVKSSEAPFTLERKIAKWSPSIARPAKRFIDTIVQVDNEDSVCIKVVAKNGLYVTKDFILTHNTSVLDCIWFALKGKDSLKDTPSPIHRGEKKAKIVLDLGDMVVTRTFTPTDTYLKVEDKSGEKYSSPQELLDSFLGRLSFDPLEFANSPGKEQREMLLSVIDLDVDVDALDEKSKALYDERTLKGRELKTAEANVKDLSPTWEAEKTFRAVEDVTVELEEATKIHFKRENLIDNIGSANRDLVLVTQQLTDLKAKITEMQSEFDGLQQKDIPKLRAELKESQEYSAYLQECSRNDERIAEAERLNKERQILDRQLKVIDKVKSTALAKAKMPLEGLSFDSERVYFKEDPFSQLGAAQQLEISLSIAMALNPKLKVIRTKDGSFLDSENMKVVEKLIKDNGFQLWLEVIDPKGKVCFEIYDGEVQESEGRSYET